MSSIIINLNDTVAMSDSTLLEMAKIFDSCQSCVHEAATTCNDVKIVGVICATIILVTLIVCGVFCFLKCRELCAKEKDKGEKENKEEKECKNKTDSDLKQRKIDLQNKLLTFLEKNASLGDYNKDKQEILSTMKDIDSKEAQYYIQVLRNLIGDKDIPAFSQEPKDDEGQEEKPVA